MRRNFSEVKITREKSGNFTQNAEKVKKLIENLVKMRMFISYLSKMLFNLAPLIPVLRNTVLSAIAMKDTLPLGNL